MADMVGLYERSVRIALADFNEQERPRLIAEHARKEVERAAAHNRRIVGREVDRVEVVDGVRGRPFEAVSPGGQIEVIFDVAIERTAFFIADVYETLHRNSPLGPPKDTGRRGPHYRDAFMVFVDGGRVLPPFDGVKNWRRIVWVNARPYARKIEGIPPDTHSGLSRQRPNGVVLETLREVRRRWKGYGLRYTFEPVGEFYAAGRIGRGRDGRRVTVASLTRARSFPAIVAEA